MRGRALTGVCGMKSAALARRWGKSAGNEFESRVEIVELVLKDELGEGADAVGTPSGMR